MIKTVIMGTGRMGSLIRTTAEGVVDAAGQPVFDIVAQIGFDLSELENAPGADVIIDFSNVVTFDAVVAYVERTGAALVSGTTGYSPEQMDRSHLHWKQKNDLTESGAKLYGIRFVSIFAYKVSSLISVSISFALL